MVGAFASTVSRHVAEQKRVVYVTKMLTMGDRIEVANSDANLTAIADNESRKGSMRGKTTTTTTITEGDSSL